jgi:hypothetical protein
VNAKIWVVAVFNVARNPEADSTLPFVISVAGELVLRPTTSLDKNECS